MDTALLRWIMILVAALCGFSVGWLAFYWKRRNSSAWMIYGALTFGAAAVILAFLPRLERRKLLPEAQRQQNWHR